MSRAIILTVDDDPAVSQAVTRDLRERYAADYQIVRAHSGPEALGVLDELARRDQPVALIVSDHRMPEMTGIEFLEQSRELAPDAKLVLLTAYADTDAAIAAINDIGLDHYLMKPWAPPEERLYPVARRPAGRLGTDQRRPVRRGSGRRAPLVGTEPRHPPVPRPQPCAVPVAGDRPGPRGRAPPDPGRRVGRGSPPRAPPGRGHPAQPLAAGGGRRPRPADAGRVHAL